MLALQKMTKKKTIYDKDGNIIPQPKRDFIKAEPQEAVARRIINMVTKRTFKQVFTPLGKLNAFMNRFFSFHSWSYPEQELS